MGTGQAGLEGPAASHRLLTCLPLLLGGDPHRLHHRVCGPLRGGRCSGEEATPGPAGGCRNPTQPVGLRASCCPAPSQIAEERKKTQLEEAAPESAIKTQQPKAGSQGPQTYRQGVGKYINPAAT